MTTPIRIKCTDVLGNVSYIVRRDDGKSQCILANGMNAALSYAGIQDEMPCKFDLEDSDHNAQSVLTAIKRYGSPRWKYEVWQ